MIPVVDKFGLPRHSHPTKKVVGQNRKLKGFCYFLNDHMHMTWLFIRNSIYMNILLIFKAIFNSNEVLKKRFFASNISFNSSLKISSNMSEKDDKQIRFI